MSECQCVCVSPRHSGAADILTGTVFSRSHSDMTDSPPPTLILPGSHTQKHTQYLYWLSGLLKCREYYYFSRYRFDEVQPGTAQDPFLQ